MLYSTLVPGVQASSFPNSGENAEPFLAVDSSGNIDVTGNAGAGFVTTVSAYQPSGSDNNNAFLAKFDPNLSGTASLLYSTYLGGSVGRSGHGRRGEHAGNAFITGLTSSLNFPTTAGALQKTFVIGGSGLDGTDDGFVAEVNPSLSGSASLLTRRTSAMESASWPPRPFGVPTAGSLVFTSPGPAIAVDGSGDAYVTGYTTSTSFPTTSGAYEKSVGSSSNLAFVSKLNPTGSSLVYSTYLGSPQGTVTPTVATTIAVDAAGNAYVAGMTLSSTFPTVDPIQLNPIQVSGRSAAFVSTLNSTGSALLFSTYLGGNNSTCAMGIAVDDAGNTFVAGITGATNFPTTAGALQTTSSGSGIGEGFAAEISQLPSFAVTGFPSATTAGVPATVTVTALNANGTIDTAYTGTVQFTSSDSQAVLPANFTFTAADGGVYAFSVTLKTGGSQSITATDTVTASMTGAAN